MITNLRMELFQPLVCSLLLDPRNRVRPVAGREVVVVEHVVPQDIVLLLQLVHLLLHTVLQTSMLSTLELETQIIDHNITDGQL